MRPRVLVAEPFADSDTAAGLPALDGNDGVGLPHEVGVPAHHNPEYGFNDQQVMYKLQAAGSASSVHRLCS